MKSLLFATVAAAGLALIFAGMAGTPSHVAAGPPTAEPEYKVLAPIRQGNLTVFPVVAASSRDTHEFLTLDEGLRSGEVVVTESGSVQPLIRRRTRPIPVHGLAAAENGLRRTRGEDG